MAGCQLGMGMADSKSAIERVRTASASPQRPSSMSSVACTLSQWLARKRAGGLPGPMHPR